MSTRGRKPTPVYIYKNQEPWYFAHSIEEAANKTNISPTQVRNLMLNKTNKNYTRQGFTYSMTPLTDEEMEKLTLDSTNNDNIIHKGRGCRKTIDKQDYEINCQDGKVTYQAASKKKRINEFLDSIQ